MLRVLLLALFVLAGPVSSQAQEVFSWWHRGLLEFDLSVGSWAEFSRTETSEGQQTKEKLRCEVLARTEKGEHWIKLRFLDEEESYVLLVAPLDSLRQGDLLQGLHRVFKILPAGVLEEEDLERVRNNRLLSRHFKDLFENPSVEREAMADTTIGERTIPRERVRLDEVREVKVKMGRSDMIYRNEALAVAQISPVVPIFGLLRSKVNTSLAPANPQRNSPPPLLTEEELVCVAFGKKSTPSGLPSEILELLHSR